MYFNPNGSGPTPGAVASIAAAEYRDGFDDGYKEAQRKLQAKIDAAYNRGYDAGWETGRHDGWEQAIAIANPRIDEKNAKISELSEQVAQLNKQIELLIASKKRVFDESIKFALTHMPPSQLKELKTKNATETN